MNIICAKKKKTLLLLSTLGFPRFSGLREVSCSEPALSHPPQPAAPTFCPPNSSTEHFPALCAQTGSPQGEAITFLLVTDASFTRIFSRLTFPLPPHKNKVNFIFFFILFELVGAAGGGGWGIL